MIRYASALCPWDESQPTTIPLPIATERHNLEVAFARGGTMPEPPPHWKDYKSHLRTAQGQGKCGWCERDTATSPGDVEHYRPKGKVTGFSGSRWENPETLYANGGSYPDLVPAQPYGYWRQAYNWDNWVLACEICNRGWKKTLFPLDASGQPLLLSPFETLRDPEDHLEFREDGTVIPRGASQVGRATIDTMGLDRPSLTIKRRDVATKVERWCLQWISANNRGDSYYRKQHAENIIEACEPNQVFAGQARAMVLKILGCTWIELKISEEPI